MLCLARHVALILHVESLHSTADVYLGHGLNSVSDAYVAHFNQGLTRRGDLAGNRSEIDDVQFVLNEIVDIQRPILRLAKLQRNGMPPSNGFSQGQNEKTGGVRPGRKGRQISGDRDLHSRNRHMFSRIGIFHHNRSAQRDRLLLVPDDQPRSNCHQH